MEYLVNVIETPLRAAPAKDAAIKNNLTKGFDVGDATDSADGLWLKVDFGPHNDQKGFVLKADCKEKDGQAPRPELDRGGFVRECVTTEFRFNASELIKPWHVLADYLIARAIIETGVTNAGSNIPGSDAVGPLQVSKVEWSNYVKDGGALVLNKNESARQHPIFQIDAAAFRMHSDIKALSALRTPAGEEGAKDPFVPEFLDVFFAYLTDSPAAALAIREAFTSEHNHREPVTKFLRGPLNDEQVAALHKARSKFFGSEATPKSLEKTVTETEALLDEAMKEAFEKDIKIFMPEVIPVASKDEAGAPATAFKDKAPRIMRDLMRDFGFTDFQAAGVVGNLAHETGGFTLFQERGVKVGKGGLGWAQWTLSRRTLFEQFCQQKGLSPTSDEANYGFLKLELERSHKSARDAVKAAPDLDTAVREFEKEFEKAAANAKHMDRRLDWARRALAVFKGAESAGPVVDKLRQLIEAGRIVFDPPKSVSDRLRRELLGQNSGVKVTPKLQELVLKLAELASPDKIRISSLIRSQGTTSNHEKGRAVDVANETVAGKLLPKVVEQVGVGPLHIDEIIFDARVASPNNDPQKWNHKNGSTFGYSPGLLATHRNHIHFSVKA